MEMEDALRAKDKGEVLPENPVIMAKITDLDAFKNSSRVRFAWDITPIGFEWGGNTVFGMAELCVGNVLMGGRVGVGFRF